MRQRGLRCVVSFHTTAGAMAAERLCRREGLEGKLISVPRSVKIGRASCRERVSKSV